LSSKIFRLINKVGHSGTYRRAKERPVGCQARKMTKCRKDDKQKIWKENEEN